MDLTTLEAILNTRVQPKKESPAVPLPDSGVDPRLLNTSYSSSTTYGNCPRRFQLNRLGSNVSEQSKQDWEKTLTFQFGHSLGELIQLSLEGSLDRREIIWALFQRWKCDLLDENPRQQKSFFHIVVAAHVLWDRQELGLLSDYEVAEFHGRKAVELSFKINLPNGTAYRGFVDLVMRNKLSGEYAILEIKSSSANYVNPLFYANSEQALGYSVVLDHIAPGLTNYTVEYLVYMTKAKKYENFSFPKTYTQRALWVRDRMWEADQIDQLIATEGSYGIWPIRGDGCMKFFSPCEYMDMCQLNTETLITPLTEADVADDTREYDVEVSLEDLL